MNLAGMRQSQNVTDLRGQRPAWKARGLLFGSLLGDPAFGSVLNAPEENAELQYGLTDGADYRVAREAAARLIMRDMGVEGRAAYDAVIRALDDMGDFGATGVWDLYNVHR